MAKIAEINQHDQSLGEMHYFFDSSFPVGYFSHSFGFETFVANSTWKKLDSYAEWITNYLIYSLWYGELVVLTETQSLIESKGSKSIGEIEKNDSHLHASRPTHEARKASLLLCAAIMTAAKNYFGETVANLDSFAITEPATLVGLIASRRTWNFYSTRLLYLQSQALALTQVLVRYARIGQTDQIKLMSHLSPVITKLASIYPDQKPNTLSALCLGIEVSQMQHQSLSPRLFQS